MKFHLSRSDARSLFFSTAILLAAPAYGEEFLCETLSPTPNGDPVVEILRVIVEGKLSRIIDQGLLEPEFEVAEKISFFVCSNKDLGMNMLIERDPPTIQFSESLFNVLYALSRAYIVGAYAYRDLDNVDKFGLVSNLGISLASAQDLRGINWNASIDDLAKRFYSVTDEQVASWTSDEKFEERLVTTISTGLYFFVLHEFCHLLLKHSRLDPKVPENASISQARELSADQCAMKILNRDETISGDGSPVSFFGLSHTVIVQILAEGVAKRVTAAPLLMTHPAPLERILSGQKITAEHLLKLADKQKAELYQEVVDDQASYMMWLIERLKSP